MIVCRSCGSRASICDPTACAGPSFPTLPRAGVRERAATGFGVKLSRRQWSRCRAYGSAPPITEPTLPTGNVITQKGPGEAPKDDLFG